MPRCRVTPRRSSISSRTEKDNDDDSRCEKHDYSVVAVSRPAATPWVASTAGGTYDVNFDRGFVEAAAARIIAALRSYRGASLTLSAYTAPWPKEVPHGQLNLGVESGDSFAEIAFVFGLPGDIHGQPFRHEFDEIGFSKRPRNPHSSKLSLHSFDECWLLACLVIAGLGPARIEFAFGV